jgi:hypothetical protein
LLLPLPFDPVQNRRIVAEQRTIVAEQRSSVFKAAFIPRCIASDQRSRGATLHFVGGAVRQSHIAVGWGSCSELGELQWVGGVAVGSECALKVC